mgnify:CR=1 FL=1
MKIVCESCQAKYSIADEKVAGKIFKIRCKRCGEVIIVRGDQQSDQQEAQPEVEAGAAPASEVLADAIWHVVVNGEQFGPYVPAQIGEMLATNQIDWEAFVWREGFDNWLPAADVPELVDAIMGPSGGQSVKAAAAADPSLAPAMATSPTDFGDGVGGAASMGADPFAEEGNAGGGGGGGLFSDPARGLDPGADLFGSTSSPFNGGSNTAGADGVVASATSPTFPLSENQRMTGARNENSVLFSLKNLQALATGSGTPEASFSASSGGGAQPGAGLATGEGSGLIDIRALASTAGIGSQEEIAGERDELLAIGSQTGAFGSLGSPMAPTAPMEEGSKNKTVFAILGGAALLGVAMIAVAIIMKPQQPASAPAPLAAVAPVAPAEPGPATEEEEKEKEDESQLSEGEKAAREAARRAKEGNRGSKRRASRSSGRRSRGGSKDDGKKSTNSASSSSSKPAAAVEPERAKPRKSRASDSIDALLSNALDGKGSRKKPRRSAPAATSSKSSLPRTPSRDQVLKALRAVQPRVSACAKGKRGVALADIVVGSSGRVKSVRVSRVKGPTASCIARAVRRAKFPRFADPRFSVKFPFKL